MKKSKTPLTKEQLASLNMDRVYRINPYILNFELWQNVDSALKTLLSKPVKYLFDDSIQTSLSKTSKGIYVFTVEPDFPFPPTINHFMYVGKVVATNTFHDRFYEYVSAIGLMDKRRNIQLLTNLWPGKTWVYVYELNTLNDNEIEDIEDNLIDNIIPPLNNRFKSKKAKNQRNLYNI